MKKIKPPCFEGASNLFDFYQFDLAAEHVAVRVAALLVAVAILYRHRKQRRISVLNGPIEVAYLVPAVVDGKVDTLSFVRADLFLYSFDVQKSSPHLKARLLFIGKGKGFPCKLLWAITLLFKRK